MKEFLGALVGAGIPTLLGLAFLLPALVQSFVKLQSNQRRAEHEREMDARREEHAREIEVLRSALGEHHIRFEGFIAKRLEVMAELYGLLADADRATKNLIGLSEIPLHERLEDVATKGGKFVDYFSRTELFLDEELADQIQGFANDIHTAYVQIGIDFKMSRDGQPIRGGDFIDRAVKTINVAAPASRRRILERFRSIVQEAELGSPKKD